MATTAIPPESLPRRNPAGGLQPITIYVRVKDGKYHPKHLPIPGRPFQDLQDLEDAIRDYFTGMYLSRRRLKRPLDPPPSTDGMFQFRFVLEHVPQRPTPSAPPHEPADIKSLKALLSTTTLGEKPAGSTYASSSSSSPESDQDIVRASPSSGSHIWERLRRDWGLMYYIRVDQGGSFHTYPHAGGPIKSQEDAESAMDRYFHDHRDPKLLMNQGGVQTLDMTIEKALYWPDGRRKKRSKSLLAARDDCQLRRLVQALVDKHNDDHKLCGELAYELKDVVHYQKFCEKPTWFYHINFTMTKVARDFNCGEDNLFFAEVKCVPQGKQEEMYVSCFCMVQPTKNGDCHGCTRNGDTNMKHPGSADEYVGGHLDRGLPVGRYSEWSDSDDDVEAKKKELRLLFTGTEDPNVKSILWMHPDDPMLED